MGWHPTSSNSAGIFMWVLHSFINHKLSLLKNFQHFPSMNQKNIGIFLRVAGSPTNLLSHLTARHATGASANCRRPWWWVQSPGAPEWRWRRTPWGPQPSEICWKPILTLGNPSFWETTKICTRMDSWWWKTRHLCWKAMLDIISKW